MGFWKLQFVGKQEKKLKGDHLETSKNFQNEIFQQCHSAENVKRDHSGVFSIHSVAKYRNK